MLLDTDRAWFVVHTKARKEEFAREQLARRCVVTFLPWVAEFSPYAGGTAMAPLFPGYLFVHANLSEQYGDIVWSPGVRCLVGFGSEASPVDDAVMDFLRARAGFDGVVRLSRAFHSGDRVQIARGPLAGLVGVVEQPCSARGRVRVLMELLRRQTTVEVPEALLSRLAS